MADNGIDHGVGQNVDLKFVVEYKTEWGQSLVLVGSRGLLGAGDVGRGIRMHCVHAHQALNWVACVSVPAGYECTYRYVVVDEGGDEIVAQEEAEHLLRVPKASAGACVMLSDQFQASGSVETVYRTAAFRDVIFRGKAKVERPLPACQVPSVGDVTFRFSIKDHTLREGQAVFVYGSIEQLGNWQESRASRLSEVSTPLWEGDVTLPCTSCPFAYRYFVADAEVVNHIEGTVEEEAGETRVCALEGHNAAGTADPVSPTVTGKWPQVVHQSDGHFRHRAPWRGAGLAVPVFSLRTRDSIGCGEFLDLKPMCDFVAGCGMHVLQILPVNDTRVYDSWWDSYPYKAISVFALHPMYLALRGLFAGAPPEKLAKVMEAAREDGESREAVDYDTTLAVKMRVARAVFDSPQGDKDLASEEYNTWHRANADWLVPYAVFNFVKHTCATADHRDWGALHRNSAAHVGRLADPAQPFHSHLRFTYWLQWHLHRQLLDAAEHARARRVVLKGDLPIGVAKESADTWMNPRLFRMDVGVGSPPDAFDPNGQNWDFPGYNWEEMAKDGYAWWRRRLAHMAQYFSAYRVDHVLGFFRVYEVPQAHITGALGHFRPSHPLTRATLETHGLWDVDRLCNPHLTHDVLTQELGDDLEEALGKYVERVPSQDRMFRFREGWRTERELAAIAAPPDAPAWLVAQAQRVRRALMRLVGNVILLQDPHDPRSFYPRFHLHKTPSFAALDPAKHGILRQLHDDYFYRIHDELWANCARVTLPALMRSTDMLMCGEDLGFVPGCVPPVMHELGIIGLRIQRMPAFDSPAGAEFAQRRDYSYMTVASPSCHDTSTLRAWYEEDAGRRERFYYRCLEGTGECPEACTPEIVHKVADQHLAAPSIFCILPLQDWLALSKAYHTRPAFEETINDPTNVHHYWRYRMQPHVEDLLNDRELTVMIQNKNLLSGRAMYEEVEPTVGAGSGNGA